MGNGFKHGISLTSPLNFAVKPYTSETQLLATVPEENTIGIIPVYALDNWSIGSEVPESPQTGDLWIRTGITSKHAFNALKENVLWVYPKSAVQYGAGVWSYVPAYSVKNGQWQFWWDGQLYCSGKEIKPATGGWQSAAVSESASLNAAEPNITRYTRYMELKLTGYNRSGYVGTANAVDLTEYSTAQIEIANRSVSNVNSRITLVAVDSQENVAASQQITGNGTFSMDISNLTGMHYIRILMVSYSYGSTKFNLKNAVLL